MKTLLKNATIFNGTGEPPFMGDVLIENDRILKVQKEYTGEADRVLELNGMALAPGFIDAHSHNDWFAIKKQPVNYFAPFIRQGITTFVCGNCGLSAIGFDPDCKYVDKMGAGLFFYKDTTGQYGEAEAFFNAIDRNAPCNIAEFVGHCSARTAVAGYDNRPLTAKEEEKMLAILERALQQGAAGISLGLMYEPGLYAQKEELKKVAALCKKYDKPMSVHPRANSAVSMSYPELLGRSHLLRALDELVEITEKTGVKLHYSHAIFVGRKSFKDKDEFLQIVHSLREKGIDVMFDIYNELLGVSVITVILPAWYQSMTAEEKKKPFTKLKLNVLVKASSLLLGFGFQDIQVAYIGEGYEKYEGKTVHQIAVEENMSDLNAYLMLCEKSNFKGRVNMGPYTTPEIIAEFEKNDNCLYMTDAWVEDFGVQNPAIYDCFPKFLRDALLGTGDSIEKTVWKMTGATADRFGIKQRGYIKEGYYADLTVFDENAIKNAVPGEKRSFGIQRVFINGSEVLQNGQLSEEMLKNSGRAIRC